MIKFLKIFIINLLVFFVCCELFLLCFYSVKNHKLMWASEYFSKSFIFDSLGNDQCNWSETIGVHPYLAIYYPHKEKCTDPLSNNYGLRGADIPLEYDPNFYTILITGGSVAEQVASRPGSENALERSLNSQWLSPNKRPFRVIGAAVAGVRQPVTLIQMELFSHVADHVVSIEGYNEHYALHTSSQQLEHPLQAWSDSSVALVSPIKFNLATWLADSAKHLRSSFFKNFYTINVLLSESISYLREDLKTKGYKLNPFPPTPPEWSEQKRQDNYINRFLTYIEDAQAVALRRNKKYSLFIQPVPYAYKKLTDSEVSAAGDISSQANYVIISRSMKTLTAKKVHVESLEKIFEDVKESLYIDNIHTNNLGVKIMSQSIAERLAQHYDWKNKQR